MPECALVTLDQVVLFNCNTVSHKYLLNSVDLLGVDFYKSTVRGTMAHAGDRGTGVILFALFYTGCTRAKHGFPESPDINLFSSTMFKAITSTGAQTVWAIEKTRVPWSPWTMA